VDDPGALLAAVRKRHGLTQAQLAARAGTSQAAISRIERNAVSPSVSTLGQLLDLMGERLVLDAAEYRVLSDELRAPRSPSAGQEPQA
jgi:transcriptional regulator with XRE-family HTH domain